MHLIDLALHGFVEGPQEGPHLCPRPRPVFGRERVDGEHMDPELLAAIEHTLDRSHAGAVTEAGGMAAAPGPAPVAVHDDPDVPRNRGVQGQHSVPSGQLDRPTPGFYPTKSATSRGPQKNRRDLPTWWGGEFELELHDFGFFPAGPRVDPLDLGLGDLLH